MYIYKKILFLLFSNFNRYAKVDKKLLDDRLMLPSLESLRWRVDVTISTRYHLVIILAIEIL